MKCDVANRLKTALEAATLERIYIDEGFFPISFQQDDVPRLKASAKRAFDEMLELSWGHGLACPTCRESR